MNPTSFNLYEIILSGEGQAKLNLPEPLPGSGQELNPWMTLNVRYKSPETNKVVELATDMMSFETSEGLSERLKLSSAIAIFGMTMQGSPFVGNLGYHDALELVNATLNNDVDGQRHELAELIETVKSNSIARKD